MIPLFPNSIRRRFYVTAALLGIVIAVSFAVVFRAVGRRGAERIAEKQGRLVSQVVENELENSRRVIVRILAERLSDPVSNFDLALVQDLIRPAGSASQVQYVLVVDPAGVVLVASPAVMKLLGTRPDDPWSSEVLRSGGIAVRRSDKLAEYSAPVLSGARPIAFVRMAWSNEAAVARIAAHANESRNITESEFSQARWQVFLVGCLVILAVCWQMRWFVRRLLRPIHDTVEATRRIASGDWSARVLVDSNDEFGELATAFNRMTAQLEANTISRDHFSDILNSIGNPVFVTDAAGRVMQANPAAEQLLGYPRASLLLRGLDFLEGPPRAVSNVEAHLRRSDGGRVAVLYSVAPIRGRGGDEPAWVCVLQDISRRIAMEEELTRAKAGAEAANRAKSEFLANMSHEIRTPMNGVIGMTELALATATEPGQREYLLTAKTSSESLLSVINDVLDFSKIEAGRLELDCTAFGLRECVGACVTSLSLAAERQGLELNLFVEPGLADERTGDPGRLRQVLLNLVGNAIKFTPSGEVAVCVGGTQQEVTFAVRDTGIGIAEEERERIFTAFSQADGSITRRFGGTGLGLTISARLVELMGGRLEVESADGGGSVFRFRLPLTAAPARAGVSPEGGGSVLIRLRSAAAAQAVRQLLESQGWREGEADCDVAVLEEAPETRPARRVVVLTPVDAPVREHPNVDAWVKRPVLEEALFRAIRGQTTAPRPADEEPLLPKLRILVAEDNRVNQRVVTGVLEKRGHTVSVAGNGAEAVERWRSGHFDVILMDVQMPGLDGMEATRRIRAEEAGGARHTPVIALTAHALSSDAQKCLDAGMDGYVTKPVQPARLMAEIARFVPSLVG